MYLAHRTVGYYHTIFLIFLSLPCYLSGLFFYLPFQKSLHFIAFPTVILTRIFFVKVTGKKSGKAVKKTLKATVTVKNPSLTLKAANEVAVGATEQITATVKPANTKVTFTSSDETIAKVDEKGVVTGVKAGDVTITAKAGKTTKTVTMTVKNVIFKDLAQTTANTFTAVVTGNTKDLKATDFSFVNVATKATVAIKEIAVDKKDATKITITTFANLTDGKAYAVTLDGTTKEITVTDGKVASVAVTPTEIPYATATTIKVVAKDANGVIVAQSDDKGVLPSGYDLTITTKTGYVVNNDLYLTNKGDTAVAKAVKHSYKFDTTGKEIETVESGDVTITAVDPATVSGFALRFSATGTTKFDDAKDGNAMPVNSSKTAYIKITDANGTEVSNYSSYTVASSDASVLQVSGSLVDSKHDSITLAAIKTGTAYVLVKDAKGNVVASLPIVIQDAAKPATLALDKTTVAISNDGTVNETAVVNATAKDQYSADYAIKTDVNVKCTATSAKGKSAKDVNDNKKDYFTVSNGTVTFKGANVVEGTYVYEISFTVDKNTTNSTYVTVEVKKPDSKASTDYTLVGEDAITSAPVAEASTTITDNNKTTKTVAFNMYELKGGVKNKKLDASDLANVTYSVKKDGKDVDVNKSAAGDAAGFFLETNVLKAVTLGVDSNVATKLDAGVYTIIATYEDSSSKTKYTRTATLTVTDKQPALSAKVAKDTVKVSDIDEDSADKLVKAAIKFTYDGKEIADSDISIKEVKGVYSIKESGAIKNLKDDLSTARKLNEEGNIVTITEVKLAVKVAGTVTYDMTVTVPNGVVTVVAN